MKFKNTITSDQFLNGSGRPLGRVFHKNTFSKKNKFYVDGAVSPTITLIPGAHAIFDQGDENNVGHYFHISRTPDGIHTAGGKQFTTDDR